MNLIQENVTGRERNCWRYQKLICGNVIVSKGQEKERNMLSNVCGILQDRSNQTLVIDWKWLSRVRNEKYDKCDKRRTTMLKKGKGKRKRERRKDKEKPCEESLRFKIAVFCSRRRSTFHDKREGTTTTTTTTSSSSPKTAAPVFSPVTRRNGRQGSDEKWGNRI